MCRKVRPRRLSPRTAGKGIAGAVLAVATLLAGGRGGTGLTQVAEAQQAQPFSISVPAELRVEASSKVPLPIQIAPEATVAKNSFVRIRGLPPIVALTEGHAIAAGSWAVPLHALPALHIILPVGLDGRSEIAINLVSIEGAVLAAAKTTLIVAAAAPARGPAAAQPSVSLGLTAPKLTPEERERALALHAKGMELAERGNIYAARKFFERAAEIGLSQSAVAAAATYDPNELSRLNVLGLQPDIEAARKWYEKARQLGAVEAETRLRRLRPP